MEYTVVASAPIYRKPEHKQLLGTYTTKQGARKAIKRAKESGKYPGVASWWIVG